MTLSLKLKGMMSPIVAVIFAIWEGSETRMVQAACTVAIGLVMSYGALPVAGVIQKRQQRVLPYSKRKFRRNRHCGLKKYSKSKKRK